MKVIMNLGSMSIIQCVHSLKFYNDLPITNEISLISLLKFYPIVVYLQLLLTLIRNITLFELYLESFLINCLQESVTQSVVHLKRSTVDRKTHISIKQHIAINIFLYALKRILTDE